MRSSAISWAVGSFAGVPEMWDCTARPEASVVVAHSCLRAAGKDPASRFGGGPVADEAPGLGEVVHRGLACLLDVVEGGLGPVRESTFGGAQQQLDAGQALGQGVVDLAGEAFAFREHPTRVLGGGQVGAAGGEILDQALSGFAFPVQRLIEDL